MTDQLHRNTDPETSRLAAHEVTQDGTIARMCAIALYLVRKHPGRTAAELEQLSGLGDGKIRKRLNDLRKDGLLEVRDAKTCKVTGRMAQVWYPADSAPVKQSPGMLFDTRKTGESS